MRPWLALLVLAACDPSSEAPPDDTELADSVIGESPDGVPDAVDTVVDSAPVDSEVTCTPAVTTPLPYGGTVGTEGVGTCRAGEAACRPDGLGWDEAPGVLPRWEDCRAPEDADRAGTSAWPVAPACVVELPAYDA